MMVLWWRSLVAEFLLVQPSLRESSVTNAPWNGWAEAPFTISTMGHETTGVWSSTSFHDIMIYRRLLPWSMALLCTTNSQNVVISAMCGRVPSLSTGSNLGNSAAPWLENSFLLLRITPSANPRTNTSLPQHCKYQMSLIQYYNFTPTTAS